MPLYGILLLLVLLLPANLRAEEEHIVTLWPLLDYRESPRERFTSLSLLGPLFRYRRQGDEVDTALRPLWYRTENRKDETSSWDFLYPIASGDSGPESSQVQGLRGLFLSRKSGGSADSMFFPFYIRGTSEKYGPYLSIFPLYGDIYERFWRDEYHYVLFPLYGRTVNKGTETVNILYPIFSVTRGEREFGLQLWPLAGGASKEGAYSKGFFLWPFLSWGTSGIASGDPLRTFSFLPLYTREEGGGISSRHYLWPFFGYSEDRRSGSRENDYLWPFMVTVRSPQRSLDRFLPFYSSDVSREFRTTSYLWPLYRREEINADTFTERRDRILYFLFSDKKQFWPVDGKSRRRTAMWPLFTYTRDENERATFTFPAPVEPVLDRDGIERSWAPLWRLYVRKWNAAGEGADSFLWNLYWDEWRGDDLAFELFPLVSYRREGKSRDLALLKGLFRRIETPSREELRFLWLPWGIGWERSPAVKEKGAP